MYFRAHLSAAPLKGFPARARMGRARDFRAHLSAAPLKERILASLQLAQRSFPRSPERGPIEGPSPVCAGRYTHHFRAHLSAAPLKAAGGVSVSEIRK